MKFSSEFKKSAVQKVLSKGNRTVGQIAEDLGVTTTTLYSWRKELVNVPAMKKPTRPQDKSLLEKSKLVFEFDSLPAEKRGEFLRRSGLHEENLIEWRAQIEAALQPPKRSSQERKELGYEKEKVKQLEKQLRRKDKALAEVSALLILKKKADLLWGSEEDE